MLEWGSGADVPFMALQLLFRAAGKGDCLEHLCPVFTFCFQRKMWNLNLKVIFTGLSWDASKKSQNQVSIRDSPAKAEVLEKQFQHQADSWLINMCPLTLSADYHHDLANQVHGSTHAFFCRGSTRRCSSRTTPLWLPRLLDLQESSWALAMFLRFPCRCLCVTSPGSTLFGRIPLHTLLNFGGTGMPERPQCEAARGMHSEDQRMQAQSSSANKNNDMDSVLSFVP